MRRVRFPLYLQVLVWFFLNLAVVAGVLWAFLHSQIGGERIVTGMADPQLQTLGQLVVMELEDGPEETWDGVLERHGKERRMELALYEVSGGYRAGTRRELPVEVREQLRMRRPPLREGPVEGEDGWVPPEDELGGRPTRDEGGRGRFGPREEEGMRRRGGPGRPHGRFPVQSVRTGMSGGTWFIVRVPLEAAESPVVLVVYAASLTAAGLVPDVGPWLWGLGGIVVLTALGWLPFVRRMTRGLRTMQVATARMAAGDFGPQVPVHSPDEIGALGESINALGTRLEGYVAGQRRFLGDIAHELCTPLARMQMAAGTLEQRAPESLAPRVADLTEEVESMSGLVAELLAFSRAGLAPQTVARVACPVGPLIEGVLHREHFPEERYRLVLLPGLAVLADPGLLGRAVVNVVRNVRRHAGGEAVLTIVSELTDGTVRLLFSDDGPGVSDEELPRLFDPFYRADLSRDRATGGAGLGLAIVKSCLAACGGTVSARKALPRGLCVVVELPLARE
jgi:two-component system, OmpR family, sensor histidine kinase CpxA